MAKRVEKKPEGRSLLPLLLQSRLLVFIIQILANALIPDHQADAFRSVPVAPGRSSAADGVAAFLFEGFYRWDAVHYVHIAQYGYSFENNLAFGPALPVLVRTFARIWYHFLPITLNIRWAMVCSAVALNLFAFCMAGIILHKLTLSIFKDERKAFLATVLFAFNPASIFFSSAYSESLFAALTWLGFYSLYAGHHVLEASICFALSVLVRSNGLLNCAFIAFALFAALLRSAKYGRLSALMRFSSLATVTAITTLLPYLYHLFGVYRMFCMVGGAHVGPELQRLADAEGYVLPGDLKQLGWCENYLPLFYSHIQSKYWDVGFLRYFQLRKLPCFLLAAPILVLSCRAVRWATHWEMNKQKTWWSLLSASASLLPFAAHISFLAVFCLFFINVEIFTRMILSCSPLIYWYGADLLAQSTPTVECSSNLCSVYGRLCRTVKSASARLLLLYWISYAVVGICLHVNFLPWT